MPALIISEKEAENYDKNLILKKKLHERAVEKFPDQVIYFRSINTKKIVGWIYPDRMPRDPAKNKYFHDTDGEPYSMDDFKNINKHTDTKVKKPTRQRKKATNVSNQFFEKAVIPA